MTLTQLINRLSEILRDNPDYADAEISTEGCDCDGDVGTILVREYRFEGKTVKDIYLRRRPDR